MSLALAIKKDFKGEVTESLEALETYSTDASLFKVKPEVVAFPADARDIEHLVQFVKANKAIDPSISLTVRAAGTDMTGGPLNDSIIADVTKHMNYIGEVNAGGTKVEPGVFYRDFEKETLKRELILPCYTASKSICALGGMIANNCAGEKTLRYGKMENFVAESKFVLSDGREYAIRPLSKPELDVKMAQNDFEGNIYKEIFQLIEENQEILKSAKPKVSKNSAGYYLWNVWDGTTFDLNRLLVGSQGTLGILTEATVKLVPVEKTSELFVIFLHDLSPLASLVNAILPTNPDSIESYDDRTLRLAFRFFPEMLKSMKPRHFFSLVFSFIPEFLMMLKGGIPKLILLVEYSGQNKAAVGEKIANLENLIHPFQVTSRKTLSEEESNKYWTVRRESFNLLRKHVHGFRTAPFVDDVVVEPKDMPEFLPKMRAILDEYHLTYTVAGHAGNGNFHIIPLMDMKNNKNIEVIKEVGEKVYSLVSEYHGSITGEHNDGIVRTPYLGKMYSPTVLKLFQRTKDIFDPQNIFNPGKKVRGTLAYMEAHIDTSAHL